MGAYASQLLQRLAKGRTLHAASDASPEGLRGGGLMFWTEPDGRKVRRNAARELIEACAVMPLHDGLLDDANQSWRLKL